MILKPAFSTMSRMPPMPFLATASGLMMPKVRSMAMDTSLFLRNLAQERRLRLAEIGRGGRYGDARLAQRRDLVLGAALATADDGARVAHAAAGRRGDAGDERRERLLHVLLGEGRGVLLGVAADLADHEHRLG